MRTQRIFQLRKTRNFSQKLEGTFDFIRITAKPLLKSLFFFTSPFILIGMFLVTNLLTSVFSMSINSNSGAAPDMGEAMAIGVSAMGFMFLMVFAGAMIMAVIYGTIRLYEQQGNGDFTPQDVWEKVKKMYWPIFGTTFLYGVIFFIGYMIVIIPMSLLFVFLSVLIIPALYIVFGFFLVVMLIALPSQLFERKSIGGALSHAFRLLKGNWWASLGLLILLMLIYNAVTVVFSIPFYASFVVGLMSTAEIDFMKDTPLYMKLLTYLFGAILLLGTFMTYSIPLIGMTLQYFNLSEEKDAISLIDRIDSFGESEPEEDESY